MWAVDVRQRGTSQSVSAMRVEARLSTAFDHDAVIAGSEKCLCEHVRTLDEKSDNSSHNGKATGSNPEVVVEVEQSHPESLDHEVANERELDLARLAWKSSGLVEAL